MSSLVEAVVTSSSLNISHSGIYFHLYTYFACLFASDKRQNGPKFCVEPHVTPKKVFE